MTGLTKEDYSKIRDELDDCSRPLFFFDDDTDGLSSFLMFYRYKKEGSGVVVKAAPNLDERFLKKVREYQPDKIFLLDLPIVAQEFLDGCKCPVIWIDHHPLVERQRVKYFNPRKYEPSDNTSTSELCYHVVEQDIWLAAIGIVGDWQLSAVTKKFAKEYPDLLSPKVTKPEKALFDTKLGHIVRIYEFLLKGPTQKVLQSMKILTRIDSPHEIVEQQSSRARLLHKRFKSIDDQYQDLLKSAKESVKRGRYLIHVYEADKISLSGELANELLYLYPKKVIVVSRRKNGEYKTSFRCALANLPDAISKALIGVEGYGGGHDHACGGCIKEEGWDLFIEQLKEAVDEQLKK